MYAVYACITEQHQPGLVALAALICLLAAITAFSLAHRGQAATGRARLAWLGACAVATGSGIWSTHFVAMLAFRPGLPIAYDLGLTALSALIAIAVTGLGFGLAVVRSGDRSRVLGGAVVGLGIAAMHYTGMAAFKVPAEIGYATDFVAASVLLGVVLGASALAVGLRAGEARARLAGAALLTLAICALHFTAMAAVTLTPSPLVPLPEPGALPPHWLAVGVGATALALLAFGLAGALVDQHLARRTEQESDRLRSLVDATFEGIAIHADGRLLDANAALLRLLGYDARRLIGMPVDGLFPSKARGAAMVQTSSGASEPFETELLRADGTRVEVEILGRPLSYRGRTVRVVAVRDVSERRRAEERIRHLAHHDALTGLPNRALFHDRLARALARARRSSESIAVLCLDLDRFKEVNDLRGHAAGDDLLCQVARRLGAAVREMDTIARLGGDEFAIIQSELQQPHGAAALAERLIAEVARPFDLDGESTAIGLSVGIALFPVDGDTPDRLMHNADTALYRAKAEGRGMCRLFEPAMDLKLRQRRALEYDLRQALAQDQLEVFYQPQADAGTGAIVGFEALVRWRHPQRGLVSPDEFIPLAEETGLILPLGERVLRSACTEAARWPSGLQVCVNLSPVQFGRNDIVGTVAAALADSGLPPERLELEVTEGVLVKDAEQALDILTRLKALGVGIAMDDFGTGYSSLSYLQRFPFDKLKIDQAFIHALEGDEDAAAIVRAVIGLGRSLRLPVVAEGVETAAQLNLLRREHCDQIQGYLIGRPLPIEAYRDLIGGVSDEAAGPRRVDRPAEAEPAPQA